jgi:O-antigen ligase
MAVSDPPKRSVFESTRWQKTIFSSEQQKMLWAKALIILATLSLAVGLGLMSGNSKNQLIAVLILGMLIGLALMLYLSEHLNWGIVLLMITAAFTPLSLPTGTSSRLVDSMLVTMIFVGLWVLRMFIVERRFHLVKSPANLPILGWIAASIFSLFWGTVFRDHDVVIWSTFPMVQVGSLVLMVMLPGAFLLVANFGRNEKILKVITWLMILAGIVGLVSHFLNVNTVNTGGLMSMWAVSVSLALALFQPSLGKLLRFMLVAHAAGWVVWSFVLNISWVTGWLPILTVIGILVFMRSRKLFFTLVAVMLVVVFVFRDYYMARITDESKISGVTRFAAWEVNWRVTGQHPLFGTGPGGYAAYYMSYFPKEAMATHNNYIDVVAQTGLVGMLFWLWFFGVICWQGFKLARRLKGRGDFLEGLANAAFAGAAACVVIMGFGDWLLPFAYTQTIAGFDYAVFSWMFMGAIVAIDHIVPAVPAAVKA